MVRTNDVQPFLARLPKIGPTNRCKLKLLKLERVQDWLLLEEEYLLDSKTMKRHQSDLKLKAVEKIRGSPMIVATVSELLGENKAIVTIGNTIAEWLVPVLTIVDRAKIKPNCNVLLSHFNFAIVGVIEDPFSKAVMAMKLTKAPTETFEDVGGMARQIQEIREAVELPLTHPEYFEALGIKAPKGVILYGPPGTGKTLLARAVANSTAASFLHVIASELVHKHIGEGCRQVREMFKCASENAPSIIFIDEIDAIGGKRQETDTSGGEREVQRTMLELLNQLDGFDEHGEIKIILATNAMESLDPALIRPGRIDRKIEIPLPDYETRKKIFELHSSKMSTIGKIEVDAIIRQEGLSGADIKAICTEAGYRALREKRMRVTNQDFLTVRDELIVGREFGKKMVSEYFT